MAYGTINADVIGTSVANTSLGAGNASIMKNRIINGAMVIDQRNAGASVTPTNGSYALDRYIFILTQTSKLTCQQNAGSVTPPVGFSNYLGITSSSAYSIATGDIFSVGQRLEGYNIADLGLGSANAKVTTLSFQVYSSLTGTFGGAIRSGDGNYSYPFTYSVSVANTWTSISVNITAPTAGGTTAFPINNTTGLAVSFGLGVGATNSGTAGSWANSSYYSATGATSVVGTSGATFYITGVQLEVGSSATGFEYRLYNQELSACQRYFQKTYPQGSVPGNTSGSQTGAMFNSVPTTNSYPNIGLWSFATTMRANPTIVSYNPTTGSTSSFVGDATNYSPIGVSAIGERGAAFLGSGVSVGTSTFVSVHATASAEL